MALSSNGKVPRNVRNQVTKRDRISRKQLTEGLKKSLASGKKLTSAKRILKSEHQSLLGKRSFNRTDVRQRFETLEGEGFLKKSLHSREAARKIHGKAAARNRYDKIIEKNVEARKKDYQREDRVKEFEKERAEEQHFVEEEDDRLERRRRAKEIEEEKIQARLERAATRREEMGLGDDLATRRIKGSMKQDKNKILAKIRGKSAPGSEAEQGRQGGGWGGPASETPKAADSIHGIGGNVPEGPPASSQGGGWTAPPTTPRRGL